MLVSVIPLTVISYKTIKVQEGQALQKGPTLHDQSTNIHSLLLLPREEQ